MLSRSTKDSWNEMVIKYRILVSKYVPTLNSNLQMVEHYNHISVGWVQFASSLSSRT